MNYGNCPMVVKDPDPDQESYKEDITEFPDGKETMVFEDFISLIKDSCAGKDKV